MTYSFYNLNLDSTLIKSLTNLEILEPSPLQYNFIKSFNEESSIIFQSKSGTGKTVSFCISVLDKIIKRKLTENDSKYKQSDLLYISQSKFDFLFGDVVIIVPTRELAYQIYLFFISLKQFLVSINSILLIGTTNLLKVINYMKKHNVNIILSTPGRFKTIFKSKPNKYQINKHGYNSSQSFFKTHTLIFDEADLLLDDQFFEQTRYICSKICNPFVQVIAVSATFLKPQFKSFEEMICEIDHIYINRLLKNYSNSNDDKLINDPVLCYYVNHMLISKNYDSIDQLFDYLSTYERVFERMIMPNTYLNTSNHLKTFEHDDHYQLTQSEIEHQLDLNDKQISSTLVLDKVDFYYSIVKDAPNIVMQIGLKIDILVRILSNVDYKKCIIFCNQSHTRVQTYCLLKYLGYQCYINSSRVSHSERVRMVYDLNSIDKVVILCTDLMSRGIGLTNVDLVINMDIPSSKEIFLHRSGRSGRFGSKGVCVSICMESEFDTYNYFLFSLNFKSDLFDNLYTDDKIMCVSPVVSKFIDFIKLDEKPIDPQNVIKQTFVSALLNFNNIFNISLLGFVSDSDIVIFNTLSSFGFMYIDVSYEKISISIKQYSSNKILFLASDSNIQILYSQNISMDDKDNEHLDVTHFVLKTSNVHLLVSLKGHEFFKLMNQSFKSIEFLLIDESLLKSSSLKHIDFDLIKGNMDKDKLNHRLNGFLRSKTLLNIDDLRMILSSTDDYEYDRFSTDIVALSLDWLGLKNDLVLKYFMYNYKGTFHNLVYLYSILCESLNAVYDQNSIVAGSYKIKNHFLSAHISLWKEIQN